MTEKRTTLDDRALDRLFAATSALIGVADKSGHFVDVNPAFTHLLGWSAEEIRHMLILDLLHPDDVQKTATTMANAVAGEPIRGFENRYRHKDGGYRHIVWDAYPDGETDRAYVLGRDVTEQRHSEERLRQSEQKFRGLSASAQDAIMLIDEDETITFWNRAAVRIFGWSPSDALGQNVHELLVPPGPQLTMARQGFARFRQTGEGPIINHTRTVEAMHRDGHLIPVELSLAPVQLITGWHAVGIARDITERLALGKQTPPPGDNRFAYRHQQPRPLFRRIGARIRTSLPLSSSADPGDAGHRPFQGNQRPLRAPGRRHGFIARGPRDRRRPARGRPVRAAGRRGIRPVVAGNHLGRSSGSCRTSAHAAGRPGDRTGRAPLPPHGQPWV